MGNTRTDLSDQEQTISDELTTAYAAYINQLGLTDENGVPLTLEASADGRYQAGSYYDYMKEIIEESLNDFLADTSFPYDADAASSHGGRGGMEQVAWAIVMARARVVLRAVQLRTMQAARVRWLRRTTR